MNIELRNIKHAAFASEETACFTATLYVDGKKEGTADNAGKGGPTTIHPLALARRLDEYAATLPAQVSTEFAGDDGTPFTYAQTGESLVDDLLAKYLTEKDVRTLLNGKVAFTVKGKKGIYRTKKLPADRIAAILAEPARLGKDVDVVLNALPFAEAVAVYAAQS